MAGGSPAAAARRPRAEHAASSRARSSDSVASDSGDTLHDGLEEPTAPEESIERTTLDGSAALEPDEGGYSELTVPAVRADGP